MARSFSEPHTSRRSSLVLALVVSVLVAACGSNGTPTAGVAGATGGPGGSPVQTGGQTGGSNGQSGGGGSGGGSLAGFQDEMVSVIQKVNPSVVLIQTNSGLGSGVVYNAGGDIVTNAHVVGNATSFKVTFADGHSTSGSLVGSFPPEDLAVIKVSGSVAPATFGDSSKLSVGDIALAMGNPLGLQSSVTQGIVSAMGRTVTEGGGITLPDMIQTSAPINPGNSGGALVDLAGQVIGIPTAGAVDPAMGVAAAGIGFAISSNRARFIADQLIQTGHVTNSGRAYLGVAIGETNGQGALVYDVVPNGPAAKAGIQSGDVITSINGKPIATGSDLQTVLAQLHPGDKATVQVNRGGNNITVTVTLGQLPG